jgi:hypothetical protein
MRRSLTALLAAGAALAAAPAAQAVGWVTSGPLSAPDSLAVFQQLAVTPQGTRVIAWVQQTPDGQSENVSFRIAAPGAGFGPTQTIAGVPSQLQIATAPDGTVALAWLDGSPFPSTVHFARLAPGATSFAEAKPFTPPGVEQPDSVKIAFSGSDVFAVVGTEQFNGGRATSLWAVKLPAGADTAVIEPGPGPGGTLDHGDNLNGQTQIVFNRPAIAADGDHVVVGWEHESENAQDTEGQTSIEYALRTGDSFGARFNIDSQTEPGAIPPTMLPAVAAGGGHVYVLWTRFRSGVINYLDTADMTPKTIDSGGTFVEDLQAGADGAGALVAAWTTEPPGTESNTSPFAIVVPAGAAAGTASPVSTPGIERELGALSVATDGTVLALADRDGQNGELQVDGALRAPGAGFGPPESISGLQDADRDTLFEDTPSAFAGPGGQALVLWSASDNSGTVNMRLHLSERDSTPPALTAVDVPSAAVAGEQVHLSATATDALSDPVIHWDFGDGSEATGGSVTHTFGAPGAATVTVTATDSAGNVSTQTRAIAIAAAGPVADTTPPTVTGLTLSPPRFRVARATTAVAASAGRGTVVRLRLSERATVVLAFRRSGGGGTIGTIVRLGMAAGSGAIPFSGRIGRTALRPGTYVLTVTAIDGAGHRSRPATARFRVAS